MPHKLRRSLRPNESALLCDFKNILNKIRFSFTILVNVTVELVFLIELYFFNKSGEFLSFSRNSTNLNSDSPVQISCIPNSVDSSFPL
jgi:hypothetical protein